MAREIVIDFKCRPEDRDFLFRIWNFGEDLWRALQKDGWGSITMEEVDKVTTQLRVKAKSKRVISRLSNLIEELLVRNGFAGYAAISVVVVPDD